MIATQIIIYRDKLRRDPSIPSKIKSQTKSYCVRKLLLYMRHLCKTHVFECRAVAFTTARHHRRGSAVKPAWCANNRGGNVAKKATARHHRGSAAVAERGAEKHDRGNRPPNSNPSTP